VGDVVAHTQADDNAAPLDDGDKDAEPEKGTAKPSLPGGKREERQDAEAHEQHPEHIQEGHRMREDWRIAHCANGGRKIGLFHRINEGDSRVKQRGDNRENHTDDQGHPRVPGYHC